MPEGLVYEDIGFVLTKLYERTNYIVQNKTPNGKPANYTQAEIGVAK